ncbi:2-polyprenyl-6-methoxyphenol hydroxylase [Oceanicola sp. D3]|nr:2-polyprenyl-6-methoxyphenol hydroxylase [Oceanicola sp. D3]
MNVAIIGGGIGGLAAANALIHQGIDVTVYERAPELGEVGAGVYITPNSLRHLYRIGLEDALRAVGAAVDEGSEYYRMDGSFVAPMQTTASDGLESLGMHRADLLGTLADALPEGAVVTGRECTGVTQDEAGVVLHFAGGETARADLAVGADGIQSRLREQIAGASHPIHSGSLAFRGLIDAEALPGWPMRAFQIWMGDGGKHFMTYPVRANRMMNYVAFIPSSEETLESWSSEGDVEVLRAAFAGWDKRVTGLLDRIDRCYWWGLYDREPLSRWTDGRVTLLGDAAHPMLPHLGQGANQAVEDGVALAAMLARKPGPEGLAAYEALRRERTSTVQAGARKNGKRYDGAYPDQAQRDKEIAASAAFRKSLYDFDVAREVEKVLA